MVNNGTRGVDSVGTVRARKGWRVGPNDGGRTAKDNRTQVATAQTQTQTPERQTQKQTTQ